MKQRKVDEEFEQDGMLLKTILSMDCKDCHFDIKKTGHCYDKLCASEERSDKLNVKFIRINKQ
jgi:hypothetical protein